MFDNQIFFLREKITSRKEKGQKDKSAGVRISGLWGLQGGPLSIALILYEVTGRFRHKYEYGRGSTAIL